MLVGTYLNLLVGNGTSGIFSGQGRPLIATILSFGLELPLSIGGVAIYILYFHGDIIGVYWWGAIAAGIEIVIVMYLIVTSDWAKCADEARERQEAASEDDGDDADADLEDGETSAATTDLVSSSSSEEERSSMEQLETNNADSAPTPETNNADISGAEVSNEASLESTEQETTTATATTATQNKGGKKKRRGKRGKR